MADATTADPTNAVEVAALLTEAAEAGTAVEAMRIVFSTTVGAQFARPVSYTHLTLPTTVIG